MGKPTSVEDYQQNTTFQSLRKTLLDDRQGSNSDQLEKPLAYWAIPSDRRLPLALLGRSVRELVNATFEDLCATPGIGRKKIASLLTLLSRATKETPSSTDHSSMDGDGREKKHHPERTDGRLEDFNPTSVSESLWEKWQDTVRKHGLGFEKLGRLAPTLQSLPSVIWHAPLSNYLQYSVAEMRQLKTHGEKRVSVVLEVFHAVHEVLNSSRLKSHLTLRLMPKFVLPVEHWIAECLELPTEPLHDSVQRSLAIPLVEQVHVDCGPSIARLAEGRLGIHAAPQSVKVQARRMGVTRARIYQLLDQCAQVMSVRWPEGRAQLLMLRKKVESVSRPSDKHQMFRAVADLFFPDEEERARRRRESSEK